MFNKKSLKCIQSKHFGHYQVHRRSFFFTEQTDDRHTTDGHNRLLNPALRMCALGKNVIQ